MISLTLITHFESTLTCEHPNHDATPKAVSKLLGMGSECHADVIYSAYFYQEEAASTAYGRLIKSLGPLFLSKEATARVGGMPY